MKEISTQLALLLMSATLLITSCDNTKNENKEQPQPATSTIAYPDREAEILGNEECDTADMTVAVLDVPGDVKVNIHRGKSMLLEMDGVSLSAADSAIIREGTYTVTALTTDELPPLADEMVNVTFGSGNGYRFLPNGEHFKPYAELRMAYDESKLPLGYTPNDIYTSYYDETKKTWVRLTRKEVDTVNKEIVSLTTHFTDFVNEILKAPEMPETQAFVPTMMTDLEAANPLEGITLIQPPTANNMGTANLSYPLQIPAGRQGMQPNLALTYNSNGGNGWLGVGWDISIPCISVETRWGVPRYDANYESESYLLNGEQLIMKDREGEIYLPHRNREFIKRIPEITRFYPRIDESKDSIIRHGENPKNYWWEVVDRNGITHYYGKKKGENDIDSECVLSGIDGNIAKWMLTESVDPFGNSIRYYYEIVHPQEQYPLAKTIYPSSIEYTGYYDENQIYHSGKYEIRFNRQGIVRPDIITSCNYGFEEVIDAILCNVTVAYDDKPFRLYHFYMHNSENTLHKTVLNKVGMIDSIMCGIDVISTIANNYCNTDSLASIQNVMSTCSSESITSFVNTTNATNYIMGNYIENKYNYSVVEHTFEYNTAPDSVFGPIVEINNLNDVGLSLPEKLLNATGYNVTELGLTEGKGWNVGGGANVGLGALVALTNSSAGLSYNYGNSTSKGNLTLIDIDGDGYQDKVFVSKGNIFYCKRINDDNGQFSYSDEKKIPELSNVGTFMKEKSHSHTLSGQLNFGASCNLSETWTTSYTENYFSDVNADGLPDLVTSKGVYFNNTDFDGNVSFFMQPNEESGIDTIRTNLMNCGSMIYDGELNDSIYCIPIDTVTQIEVSGYELSSDVNDLINDGWIFDSIIPPALGSNTNLYYAVLHKTRLICDSIQSYNEQMVSMTNTEAVKVWVAPYNGEIEIVSKINMYDTTGGLVLSRYADGITYKVQHDRINYNNVTNNTFSCSSSVVIPELSGTLMKNHTTIVQKTKTITVNKGDIIYFRLQSNNTNYYDHVEWKQSIRYIDLDDSEDLYGKQINQYNSYEDFIVSGNKYFQAVDSGNLDLTIDVNVGQLKSRAKLRVYKNASVVFDEFLRSDMGDTTFYENFYVEKDAVVIIIITDDSLSNKTTFGNIVCKPHYNFTPANNSVIKGSVEYDIPAYYHVNTNIKPIYTNIFGPLYRGWGQFTYNPKDHDTLINIADLRPMIPVDSSDVPEIEDSIVSPENIDTTNMSLETFNDIVESKGINLVSTDAKYYVMEGNSKHWLWYGPANTTMITSTQMSNTIRTDIYSTYEEEVEIIRDCPAPAPTTEYPIVKTHSKTSESSNFNRNYSGNFSIYGNVGYSRNSGSSKIIADFMDLNGDRYPDLIANAIQYTKPSGGLNNREYSNFVSTSDATSSRGFEAGGSSVNAAYLHNRKNQTANRSESTGFALNVGSTKGNGESEEMLMDINGDGLPDKIYDNGTVLLNWGYSFFPSLVKWFGGFKRKSSFETGGLNFNGNNLFNICQFSIGGGFGINYSHNTTDKMLIDINGDGLPDQVVKNNSGLVYVRYNIGYGEWGDEICLNITDFIRSHSLSGSTNISGTIGFTIFTAKVTGSLSGSVLNPSCNIDKIQLADFNNDGLPDFVTSDDIGSINVRYNQLGGVNLLTKVTYPMEGTIEINYSLTESSINNPHRQWVMDTVTIDAQNSPLGGSVMKNAFEYSNPYYDRYERTSYGFEKVRTSNLDSNNNVYRYTEEDFVNTNYALKNKLKKVALFDGSGKKYTETLYDMEIIDPEYNEPADDNCLYWVAPIIKTEINNFYEGTPTAKLTTMISYEYDKYQNIVSYRNWGDNTFVDDDLTVNITYLTEEPLNMIGLKKNFVIKSNKTGAVMREYVFEYDKGKLTKERIINNNGLEAVYSMHYDKYGNVVLFEKPADEHGQVSTFSYIYDAIINTYPITITDAFNITATATYDYRFGVPLEKTDPSGNRIVYTYDYRGRTKTITGPKELAANKPYTILMEYYPTEGTGQSVNMGVNRQFPYSITYHYDQQHPNDNIETIVICDKIGRILQTKKDAVVNGVPKNMVSGKIQLDEFGRTIKQYLPFSESTGNDTIYSGTATGTPTMMEYDIMDRQTNITYPGNAVVTSGYSVANDYSGKRRGSSVIID